MIPTVDESFADGALVARTVRPRVPEVSTAPGMACFTWDDGNDDILTVADIHEARGQRFTIAVTSGLIGNAGKVTEAQLETLAAAGHELAAHSVTHANFVTGGLTAAQRASEYDTSKAYCEARSGRPCTTWVYPYGGAARNDTTDRELTLRFARFFDVGSNSNQAIYDRRQPYFPPRHIVRLNLTGDTENQNLALEYIRQAATSDVVVVFMCHQLDEVGAPTTAQYTALAQEAADLGVQVVPTDEAFPVPVNLRDPGFEYADIETAWNTVLTGDGVAESVLDTPVAGLSGSRSLHLSVSAGSTAYVTQVFPVRAGETYTLSGRYRTSAGLGNFDLTFRARQFDVAAASAGSVLGGVVAESTTWTRHTVDLVASATAAYWAVDILLDGTNTGEAWVDHLDIAPKVFGSYG